MRETKTLQSRSHHGFAGDGYGGVKIRTPTSNI
jgi:hypothetical protein